MKKYALLLIILGFSHFLLPSLEIVGIEGRIGGILYGYAGEERNTASPLKQSFSISVLMDLAKHFEFQPELTLFYFDYVWDSSEERAVPAAIETADRISVFHFLINPVFTLKIPLDEKIFFGITMTPSLLFRLPLSAADNGNEYRGEISEYLYSDLRFFYPALGGLFRWRFSTNTAFSVSASCYIPLFNVWDGSSEAFVDQIMVTGSAGFLFYL